MAREGGGAGGFDTLTYVAIGLLVLAVVFMLIPVIGGSFDANMPALSATSQWNASYNTKLVTGSTFWTGLSPFIYLAALFSGVFRIRRKYTEGERNDRILHYNVYPWTLNRSHTLFKSAPSAVI